jgi:hypothetical protein
VQARDGGRPVAVAVVQQHDRSVCRALQDLACDGCGWRSAPVRRVDAPGPQVETKRQVSETAEFRAPTGC